MYKVNSLQVFKAMGSAFKESIVGGRKGFDVPVKGDFFKSFRTDAQNTFNTKISPNLVKQPHRARIKGDESIRGIEFHKGKKLDDLVGMQYYEKKSPQAAIHESKKLFDGPVTVKKKNKKGYKGVNIQGKMKGVPTEIQLSPGKRSNFGQILQHNAYKPPEGFTKFDKKVSDMVGGAFVNRGLSSEWKKFLS